MALKSGQPAIGQAWIAVLPKLRSRLARFFGSDVWFLTESCVFWMNERCYSLREGVLLVPYRTQDEVVLQHVEDIFHFAQQLRHIAESGGARISGREEALRQFVSAVSGLEERVCVLFYSRPFRRFLDGDLSKRERADLLGSFALIYGDMRKIPSFGSVRAHLREATGAVLLQDVTAARLKLSFLLIYLRRTKGYLRRVLDALEEQEKAAA